MARFLELANVADTEKGTDLARSIKRTMLDEGASVDDYRTSLARALD